MISIVIFFILLDTSRIGNRTVIHRARTKNPKPSRHKDIHIVEKQKKLRKYYPKLMSKKQFVHHIG